MILAVLFANAEGNILVERCVLISLSSSHFQYSKFSPHSLATAAQLSHVVILKIGFCGSNPVILIGSEMGLAWILMGWGSNRHRHSCCFLKQFEGGVIFVSISQPKLENGISLTGGRGVFLSARLSLINWLITVINFVVLWVLLCICSGQTRIHCNHKMTQSLQGSKWESLDEIRTAHIPASSNRIENRNSECESFSLHPTVPIWWLQWLCHFIIEGNPNSFEPL